MPEIGDQDIDLLCEIQLRRSKCDAIVWPKAKVLGIEMPLSPPRTMKLNGSQAESYCSSTPKYQLPVVAFVTRHRSVILSPSTDKRTDDRDLALSAFRRWCFCFGWPVILGFRCWLTFRKRGLRFHCQLVC